MRVLHVNNINHVAETYARELVRRGHTAAVYEPNLRGGFASLPIKLAMMPGRLLDLRHIIGELNPDHFDIVHIHWASYGVLGLASQIPFVIHCHGSDVRDRLKQPFFRPLLTGLLRRAAAVTCISPDLLPIVCSVRSDAIFLPAAIDTEVFSPEESNVQCVSEPWTILLFARLDPFKGVDAAARGIARFAERHGEVRVRLLDWGSLRGQYKSRYSHRFEFIPQVPQGEVSNLIRSADVIVGQLIAGALGLSELQAMSCGKPLITSFRYEDAYPTRPPVCQATTDEEVEEHLEYLFHHQESGVALGKTARDWVIRHHGKRVLVRRLEELYLPLVGHSSQTANIL